MHSFCLDDLNYCVSGTMQKYAIARPLIPTILPIQESTDLIQKEVITLDEARFSFDHICARSLFGSQLFSSNILHVPTMSAHCWPTTHGGKMVR
jgi:hypothetical protein